MKLAAIPENWRERLALFLGFAPTPLLDTLVGLLLARSIITGASVGIFDALRANELTCGEISARCRTQAAPTSKLLSALCACGYLKFRRGRYRLSDVTRRWLTGAHPKSLRAAVLLRNLDLRFMNFEDYVRDGVTNDFHAQLNAEEWTTYHDGQASHAALMVEEVVRRVPLPEGAVKMVDLGGGHGLYSFSFCTRYPMLRARVVDLKDGLTSLRDRYHSELAERVRFEQGDVRTVRFREASADLVLFANLAHHFDESTNRQIISRAATALRSGGVLIFVDAVRPVARQRTGQIEALLDLYFGATSGSGLWTLEEIRSWIGEAGLKPLSPVSIGLVPCFKMVVGLKR